MSKSATNPAEHTAQEQQPEDDPLGMVLKGLSDAFVALDRDERYTFVNERAAAIFGRPAHEMIGQHIWTLFPDSVSQPIYQAHQRALATQQLTCIDHYHPPWERWIESRIYPSKDGLSIFFQDITARKRAEALLVGQNHVLELLTQGAPLREVLEALLHFIEEQCPGTRGSILLLESDGIHMRHGASPSLPESFTNPINGAEIGPLAGSCGTAAYLRQPVMVEDIATDPRWVNWRALALPLGLRACWSTPIFDDKKSVLGTFAMYYGERPELGAHDQSVVAMATRIAAIAITHDRDQKARRESESRYRQLVDSNVIGVMILDRRGIVLEANDEFLRMVGMPRESFVGGALAWSNFCGGSAATGSELFERLATSGASPPIDCECSHKLGQKVYMRVTAAPLEGRESGAICLVEDITERREQARVREKNVELEESNRAALEANRLKSEFLASMSHELRTPLNAIIGFSELLTDGVAGGLNDKQTECLAHVLTSGRHLLKLINDVLDLAKVEAGKLELFPIEFCLSEELEDVCSVVRALAKEKDIAISLLCDPRVDRVTLDPGKLKQVLFNLLANAVKFTGDGGRVEVETSAVGPSKLEIRVRDTGIGIRREDLPRLFQEFRQLNSGRSGHEGTGLGLMLSKRLVESQHGQITVESVFGQGSTFHVLLPRVLLAERVPSTPPQAS